MPHQPTAAVLPHHGCAILPVLQLRCRVRGKRSAIFSLTLPSQYHGAHHGPDKADNENQRDGHAEKGA